MKSILIREGKGGLIKDTFISNPARIEFSTEKDFLPSVSIVDSSGGIFQFSLESDQPLFLRDLLSKLFSKEDSPGYVTIEIKDFSVIYW